MKHGTKYRLKEDRLGWPAGTIVYRLALCDYGVKNDDTRATGIEHVSVTQDPEGGYPFITAPVSILEEVVEISPEPESSCFRPPESWEATPYGEHWSFAYTPERGEREDYDFHVELHEAMSEAEERAVISTIEAAPRLLTFAERIHQACAVQANLLSTASEADRSRFIAEVYALWNDLGRFAVAEATDKEAA